VQQLQKLDSEIETREVYTYLGLAIAATVITVVIVLVIWVMLKRIKLVIQLFEEAGKAISAMPSILLIPFLVRSSSSDVMIVLMMFPCLLLVN